MDFSQHFDIPENIVYLNTPSSGLLPSRHAVWRDAWNKERCKVGHDTSKKHMAFIQQGKGAIAAVFRCKSSEVFCTPNFSWAHRALLAGLPKESSFLLLGQDYPSLNYPVIAGGFNHHILPADEYIEERVLDYVHKKRPSVFLLSIVQYISGLKIDLSFIKKLKKDFPELIIVGDATQYAGTEGFDFQYSGFDAVATSGYKWLLSGYGNGFILIKEQLQAKLFSEAQSVDKPKEGFYGDKGHIGLLFEPGHLDSLAFGTLFQSLSFIQELGQQHIAEHIRMVSAYAHHGLEDRGLLLPAITKRSERSSLIHLSLDTKYYDSLIENGIYCSVRGNGIRIGIHLYNSIADVERLLHVIDDIR